jgi:hypothetical protein
MVPLHIERANSTLRRMIKRFHFPMQIMLVCVRCNRLDDLWAD